jgi:flavin-dependent dehydrogenase
VTAAPVHDVAVVGGGPAGCAAAIALRAAGLRVTLVDDGRPTAGGVGQTLPTQAMPLLARLGAGDAIPAAARLPCAGLSSAWGEQELAWRDGFTQPLGSGWHIDRGLLDPALRRIAAASGARLLSGHRVTATRRAPGGGWVLDIATSSRIRDADGSGRSRARGAPATGDYRQLPASFLIDASGRRAAIARLGGQRHVADRLMAVHARVDSPARAPVLHHATIESGRDGWWYTAARPDGGATAVFFSDPDVIRLLSAAGPDGWHRILGGTRHAFTALGSPARPAAVGTAAAASGCLVRLHGPGWAAAGDAATAWDPLSSAGLTMALWSGLEVAAAVNLARHGDQTALPRYEHAVHRRYTAFLTQRATYYHAERRWPAAPFWSRRAP